MADLLIPFIILTLIAVIIIQAIERYFFAKQANEEHTKLTMALLSKSSGELAIDIKKEKEPTKFAPEPDEVDLSQADDEVFDKHIGIKKE